MGWFVTRAHFGFLIPMTLVNLAALILILLSMFMGNKVASEFDPTDPRSLIFASGRAPANTGEEPFASWDCQVTYSVSG